jgi:hypothetical protein
VDMTQAGGASTERVRCEVVIKYCEPTGGNRRQQEQEATAAVRHHWLTVPAVVGPGSELAGLPHFSSSTGACD